MHNPGAGLGDTAKQHVMKLLRDHGYRVHYGDVHRDLDNQRVWAKGDIAVAAGGDGTVRRVLFAAADRMPVALLPLGSANNIARSLGVPLDPCAAVSGWRRSYPKPIDFGIARGPWGERRFIEGVGIGLLARAMAIMSSLEHCAHRFDSVAEKLHRDRCILLPLAHELDPVRARTSTRFEQFLMFEVMNVGYMGPALCFAPHPEPQNALTVVSVGAAERRRLIRALEQHIGNPEPVVRLPTSRKSAVRFTVGPCEVRVDDCIIASPARFRCWPRHRAEIDVTIQPAAAFVLGSR